MRLHTHFRNTEWYENEQKKNDFLKSQLWLPLAKLWSALSTMNTQRFLRSFLNSNESKSKCMHFHFGIFGTLKIGAKRLGGVISLSSEVASFQFVFDVCASIHVVRIKRARAPVQLKFTILTFSAWCVSGPGTCKTQHAHTSLDECVYDRFRVELPMRVFLLI